VPHAIAIGLQRRGVEATTLADAKLLGQTDVEIIAYALTQSYVIYTNDDDFPALAAQGVKHAGIIFAGSAEKRLVKSFDIFTSWPNVPIWKKCVASSNICRL